MRLPMLRLIAQKVSKFLQKVPEFNLLYLLKYFFIIFRVEGCISFLTSQNFFFQTKTL